MPEKIVFKNVRICYVNVFEPRAMEGSDVKKYGLCILIPKGNAQIKKVEELVLKVAKEKWPKKVVGNKLGGGLKNPLRDGDEDREEHDEYEGMMFLNANSTTKPKIYDKDKSVIGPDDGIIYSGCYANVSVNLYAFDLPTNKGVAVGLNALQFHKHGENLGGGGDYSGDFEEEEYDEDDDI